MDVTTTGLELLLGEHPVRAGLLLRAHFTFDPASGEQYDNPTIWGPPFFGGPGFVGVKYLRSPTGAGEIQLFSNTINASHGFRDPANVFQLFRYLSGNLDPTQGDQACNGPGWPRGGHLLHQPESRPTPASTSRPRSSPWRRANSAASWWRTSSPRRSRSPASLPTAEHRRECRATRSRLTNAALLGRRREPGRLAHGFNGFTDINGDGTVEQTEIRTIPGSLLNKALTAQVIFDNGFLLPFAPTTPNFYLIPGNNQVSIVWQPTAAEIQGDPYYVVASDPGHAARAERAVRPELPAVRRRGLPDLPRARGQRGPADAGGPVRLRRHRDERLHRPDPPGVNLRARTRRHHRLPGGI